MGCINCTNKINVKISSRTSSKKTSKKENDMCVIKLNEKIFSSSPEEANVVIVSSKRSSRKASNKFIVDYEYLRENEKKEHLENPDTIKIDTKTLIKKKCSTIDKEYKIVKSIGSGAYGTIYKVMNKNTGAIRAMKCIKKLKTQRTCSNFHSDKKKQFVKHKTLKSYNASENFVQEIELMKEIQHPNIIKLLEYYEDKINYYLILEYVPEGNLQDKLSNMSDNISEEIVSLIMRDLLSAVCFIHSREIVHGDIKPENILVEKLNVNTKEVIIKVCDFGTCNRLENREQKLLDRIGSPYFIAPEAIKGEYDEKCDIWSCGSVMYFLLTGKFPFDADNSININQNILDGKYDLNTSGYYSASKEAKKLLEKLLKTNPNERISAAEALKDPWFTKHQSVNQTCDVKLTKEIFQRMKLYNLRNKLQQATLAFIVHFIDLSDETSSLLTIFKEFNTSGDGKISFKELKTGFEKIKGEFISESEIANIFDNLDQDYSGFIEYEEFLRASLDYSKLISESNLKAAFQNFDQNGDGKLSKEELRSIFNSNPNEYFDELLQKIDENSDGEIDFYEFSKMMNEIFQEILSSHCSLESHRKEKTFENTTIATNTLNPPKKSIFSNYLRSKSDKDTLKKEP